MKRILAFALACLWALPVLATTTVSGNLKDLTGTAATSRTFVRFRLAGCSNGQPRVLSTAVIAPSGGGANWYFDFTPDSSGNISGTLYSTRDSTGLLGGDIDCNGSATAVFYFMSIWTNGQRGPEIPVHAKNGVTLNINSVTPITSNPVVTAPTGDTTYCRLDGGNCGFTGNITTQGINAGTNSISGGAGSLSSLTVSGGATVGSLNNVILADAQSGVDPCAKITTAVGLLPTTGGIIDARGFQGTVACATAPSLTNSGILLLGNVTFQLNSSASAWTIPHGWFVQGPWQRADGSGTKPGFHLQAITGFPTSTTPMVTVGSATPFDEGPTLMNAWVDCNGIGQTAITSSTINEKGGIRRVLVTECTGTHVSVVSGGPGQPQNYVIDELEILSTATNQSGNTGLAITANGNSFGQVSNITVAGKSASKFQNCITIDNYSGGLLDGLHCEQAVDALVTCPSGGVCNAGAFSNITGDPGVTNSVVHIKTGTNGAHFSSISQQGTPGTTAHTVIDDVKSKNDDDYSVSSYSASNSTARDVVGYLLALLSIHSPLYDDGSTHPATSAVYNTANNVVMLAARKADNSGDEQIIGTDAFGDVNICSANVVLCQILSPAKFSSTVTNYNSVATAGIGVVPVYGATSQKSETASADTNVLTFTPPAAAGTYRACFTASVSSATSGVIGWTLSWTDSNGNAQSNIAQSLFQQGTAAPALTFTVNAAGNYQSCSQIDVNNAAANIVVKWVGGGTTAAKVSATIERMQ